jgi:hypothetical protein
MVHRLEEAEMSLCTLLASIAFIAVFGLIVVAFDRPRSRRQRRADDFIAYGDGMTWPNFERAFERAEQERGFRK